MGKQWPPPGARLVDGRVRLTREWSLVLPAPFARRMQTGSLVLWQPTLTLRIETYQNDHHQTQAERLAEAKAGIESENRIVRESTDGGIARLTYRPLDDHDDEAFASLTAIVFNDRGHLQIHMFFDDPADEKVALAIADSVTLEPPAE